MTLPSISIITPTRNEDPDVLRRALHSVWTQSVKPSQHIVINGGDDDREFREATNWCRQHPGFEIYHRPPKGIYDAINYGLSRVTGDIIGIVHANDRLASPQVLGKVAQTLAQHPEADYVYGDIEFRGGNDRHVLRRYSGAGWHPDLLHQGFAPPHPSLYIRHRALDKVPAYDCRYKIASDFDFFLRLHEAGCQGVYIPMTAAEMSYGGTSTSIAATLWRNTHDKWRVLHNHGIKISHIGLLRRYVYALKANRKPVAPAENQDD